jgi:tetratricopeptide (TPR) repeat protein
MTRTREAAALHPRPEQLLELDRGKLSRAQIRRIVRHLLAGCARCSAVAAQLLPGRGRAEEWEAVDYSYAFAAAERRLAKRQQQLADERAEAHDLLAELAAHPYERRWMLVTQSVRFRTWSVCEQLIDEAREAGFHDPARAVEYARLAVELAERLDPFVYGEERVRDLAARAWGTLGNAQRIRSDFRDAGASLAQAERVLRKGTGDPLEKAHLLLFKSSLLGNQRRFAELFPLLDRVVALARRINDRHLEGKALITKGLFESYAGQTAAAIASLRRGLELADPVQEHRLVVAGHHNLIFYLLESDQVEEALACFAQSRPLYERFEDRMGRLRVRWLEGKIALATGRFEEAETILLEVRERLVDRELGFDVALASLDLVQLYTRQGRTSEVRRLAEQMLPLFESRDVQREALVALAVLQRAAARERVTVGLVREVGDFLCRYRTESGLRFRDPV